MSKKIYSSDLKLKVVQYYLEGRRSIRETAEKFHVDPSDVRKWKDVYNMHGVVVIMVLGVIAMYYWCVGMSDSNGGGWLLMILIMLGIACLPWLLSLAAQLAMYIVGFIQYRRNNVMRSRVFGLISSIASVVANLISSITLLSAFSKEWSYFIVILSVGAVVVTYCITTLVLSCINMSK